MNTALPRVMLLFGGQSSEHTISCATAAGVYKALDLDAFEVIPVGITRDGQWVLVDFEQVDYSLNDDPTLAPAQVQADAPGCEPLYVQLAQAKFYVKQGQERPAEAVSGAPTHEANAPADGAAGAPTDGSLPLVPLAPVDVVLPLLHGPFGEDGTLQGLLDLMGLPYVGCGVLASAACMEKGITKTILQAAGLSVGEFYTLTAREWANAKKRDELREWVAQQGGVVFVKPCRAGSSMGVSKVSRPEQLDAAIEKALLHDPHLIIEPMHEGWEVECAVLQPLDALEHPQASVLGCIGLEHADSEFYDYETKYYAGGTVDLQIPAPLAPELSEHVREMAVRAFEALQCEGLARVDFFVNPATGSVIINEINTLPGFTPFSMYPALWEATGLSYPDLLKHLVKQALGRPKGLR